MTTPLTSQNVLVVENDAQMCLLLEVMIKRQGAAVHMAADGREALDWSLAHPPFLIVTDLRMPHMDGWELIRRIRDNERTSHIPVIAVTGTEVQEKQLLAAGFSAFVRKPLNLTSLRQALIVALAWKA